MENDIENCTQIAEALRTIVRKSKSEAFHMRCLSIFNVDTFTELKDNIAKKLESRIRLGYYKSKSSVYGRYL